MADREKVIKAWEIFRDSNPYKLCSGREFRAIREPKYCMGQMIEDTIALLKEQETKPIAYTDNPNTGLPVAHCPKCGKFARQFDYYTTIEETHFCPWCGQAVKWE